MAYLFNGTNQWLGGGTGLSVTVPFALSARFKKTASSVKNGIFLGNLAGFYFDSSSVRGYVDNAGTADWAIGSYTIGQWHHVCICVESTTSRAGYIDGAAVANTTTVFGTTFAGMQIGAFGGATTFDGDMAEVAAWNEALTAADVVSLSKGFAAHLVRPQALAFYAPMIRDLNDIRGGMTITNNNGATVSRHPRVYR
jgi:hypothetical protein